MRFVLTSEASKRANVAARRVFVVGSAGSEIGYVMQP